MRNACLLATLTLGLTGCLSLSMQGIAPAAGGVDNPNVTVTANREEFRSSGDPLGLLYVSWKPEPPLSVSFKRALQKYVDHGRFRIENEAVFTTGESPVITHVILYVSTNEETYRLQADREYGFISRFQRDLPLFLDDCARQLAAKLKEPASTDGVETTSPRG